MGTRNRQRRAEKRRRHERLSAPRPDPRVESPPVRQLIQAAVVAVYSPDGGPFRALLGELTRRVAEVAVEMDVVLGEALADARERNWDVKDVVHQAGRRLGAGRSGPVADLLGASEPGVWRPGSAHFRPWADRQTMAADDAMACAIEVLALLRALPQLPPVGQPTGSSKGRTRAGHARVLERVRALLAKAESTTFPEEAEALSSKAQELMARHAIDEAMVGAGVPVRRGRG